MGGCQNYGPFLGPLNTMPYYTEDPKRDHNFENHPYYILRSTVAIHNTNYKDYRNPGHNGVFSYLELYGNGAQKPFMEWLVGPSSMVHDGTLIGPSVSLLLKELRHKTAVSIDD